MHASIFTLCEYAQEARGRLVIAGTFDSVGVPQFPLARICVVAMRLHFVSGDEGEVTLHFVVEDESGAPVEDPIPLKLNVQLAEGSKFTTRNLILNLPLQLAKAGQYEVLVRNGDRELARIPLTAFEVPQSGGESERAAPPEGGPSGAEGETPSQA